MYKRHCTLHVWYEMSFMFLEERNYVTQWCSSRFRRKKTSSLGSNAAAVDYTVVVHPEGRTDSLLVTRRASRR